jgi:hypothetical protein
MTLQPVDAIEFLVLVDNCLDSPSSVPKHVHTEHWFGIRDSIKAILAPPGARACWSEIKNWLNPEFRAFVDSLIAAHA